MLCCLKSVQNKQLTINRKNNQYNNNITTNIKTPGSCLS